MYERYVSALVRERMRTRVWNESAGRLLIFLSGGRLKRADCTGKSAFLVLLEASAVPKCERYVKALLKKVPETTMDRMVTKLSCVIVPSWWRLSWQKVNKWNICFLFPVCWTIPLLFLNCYLVIFQHVRALFSVERRHSSSRKYDAVIFQH